MTKQPLYRNIQNCAAILSYNQLNSTQSSNVQEHTTMCSCSNTSKKIATIIHFITNRNTFDIGSSYFNRHNLNRCNSTCTGDGRGMGSGGKGAATFKTGGKRSRRGCRRRRRRQRARRWRAAALLVPARLGEAGRQTESSGGGRRSRREGGGGRRHRQLGKRRWRGGGGAGGG